MTRQPVAATSSGTVLVTGATGVVGRQVVDGLLAAGRTVRALSRDPDRAHLPAGVDVRAGDLTDPAAVRAAMDGIAQLYLFPAPDLTIAADAAAAAGVGYVVLLSSASAAHAPSGDPSSGDDDDNNDSALAAMAAEHHAAERAVRRAGLPSTALRPGPFMGNDLVWAPEIQADATICMPYPDAASAPVDERDVADAAVAALQDPTLLPEHLLLTGPCSLTQRERVAVIAEVLGRPVRLLELTPERARELWAGLPDGAADHILDLLARAPAEATVTPEVGAYGLTRRPYADWVRRNRAEFTG